MNPPPAIMRVRIIEQGRKRLCLWLPLFLLWPIGLLVLILLSPLLVLLALLRSYSPGPRRLFEATVAFFEILAALRELEIEVEDEDRYVLIRFR